MQRSVIPVSPHAHTTTTAPPQSHLDGSQLTASKGLPKTRLQRECGERSPKTSRQVVRLEFLPSN